MNLFPLLVVPNLLLYFLLGAVRSRHSFKYDEIEIEAVNMVSAPEVKNIIVTGRDVGKHISSMFINQSFTYCFWILLSEIFDAYFKDFNRTIKTERNTMTELCFFVSMTDEFCSLVIREDRVRVHILRVITFNLNINREYFF